MAEPDRLYTALGLMSGTSLDGIDVALVRTDGMSRLETGPGRTFPYSDVLRGLLRMALTDPFGDHRRLEEELTQHHAQAVRTYALATQLNLETVDVVGFHGQTLYHNADQGVTRQIGDGALLASLLGCPVVNDFRSADVEAGGQGAPLVPIYHAALTAHLNRPLAALNIGGVANVTYIGAPPGAELDIVAQNLIAFDTGPGNALIDDWVWRHTGRFYDAEGALAAQGTVDSRRLADLLNNPFFDRPPPKSLDRHSFTLEWVADLGVADGAATLTAFTVGAVIRAAAWLPERPVAWLVCGGGRRNKRMMDHLQVMLGTVVEPIDVIGIDGDAIEAQAFGYLAVRSLLGLPLTYPLTTGCPEPMTGGEIHHPAVTHPPATAEP